LTYDSVKEVLETGVFELVEGRCSTGCHGIVLYPPKWNMQRHKIEQIICAAFYMLEMLYEKHEDVEIHGIRLLEDFSNFSFLQQLKMEAHLLTAGKPIMEFIQVSLYVTALLKYFKMCRTVHPFTWDSMICYFPSAMFIHIAKSS